MPLFCSGFFAFLLRSKQNCCKIVSEKRAWSTVCQHTEEIFVGNMWRWVLEFETSIWKYLWLLLKIWMLIFCNSKVKTSSLYDLNKWCFSSVPGVMFKTLLLFFSSLHILHKLFIFMVLNSPLTWKGDHCTVWHRQKRCMKGMQHLLIATLLKTAYMLLFHMGINYSCSAHKDSCDLLLSEYTCEGVCADQ